MSNEKFTQGEWRAEIEDHSFCDTGDYITTFGIVTGKNQSIAECFDTGKINEEEAAANCYLIAAAPELYWVLKRLIELTDYAELVGILSDAKTILKKARGEE